MMAMYAVANLPIIMDAPTTRAAGNLNRGRLCAKLVSDTKSLRIQSGFVIKRGPGTMIILVIGATGNVGRPTVAGLLPKGEPVRALSRSEDNLDKLPIEEASRNSGADYAFLRPNFFMHTDMSVIKEHSVYAMPIGSIGNSRLAGNRRPSVTDF
jgi:hypothetical protein